jgi:hypothetical protein
MALFQTKCDAKNGEYVRTEEEVVVTFLYEVSQYSSVRLRNNTRNPGIFKMAATRTEYFQKITSIDNVKQTFV